MTRTSLAVRGDSTTARINGDAHFPTRAEKREREFTVTLKIDWGAARHKSVHLGSATRLNDEVQAIRLCAHRDNLSGYFKFLQDTTIPFRKLIKFGTVIRLSRVNSFHEVAKTSTSNLTVDNETPQRLSRKAMCARARETPCYFWFTLSLVASHSKADCLYTWIKRRSPRWISIILHGFNGSNPHLSC